jgi:hypothetical protein
VAVAALVTVVVMVVHETTKKKTITGCVNGAPNEITLTDQKDRRVYRFSGDTTGVKPGEGMTLPGKKINPKLSSTPTWETEKIIRDFGVCQPQVAGLAESSTCNRNRRGKLCDQ